MTNPSKHEIQKYLKNAFRQLLKGKKSQFIIGIIFAAILALTYFYDDPQFQNPPQFTQYTLEKNRTYACRVSRISDGDSITVICPQTIEGNRQSKTVDIEAKIRIWGIDAPEMKQAPFGQEAKNRLTNLLPNRKNDTIEVKIKDKDQYSRYVSQLFFNKKDIGLEMVKAGQAVVYQQFNKEEVYKNAQKQAEKAKIGIWKKPGNQQDPANWRKVNSR